MSLGLLVIIDNVRAWLRAKLRRDQATTER